MFTFYAITGIGIKEHRKFHYSTINIYLEKQSPYINIQKTYVRSKSRCFSSWKFSKDIFQSWCNRKYGCFLSHIDAEMFNAPNWEKVLNTCWLSFNLISWVNHTLDLLAWKKIEYVSMGEISLKKQKLIFHCTSIEITNLNFVLPRIPLETSIVDYEIC